MDGQEPEAWVVLGDILADRDPQASLAAYQKAAEQGGYWLTYGNALCKHGRHAEAIEAYTRAVADEPAIAHRNIAIEHHDCLDDIEAAERHHRLAVEAGDVVAGRLLGEVLEHQGRSAEAAGYLQAAADGGDPRALVTLGWSYRNLNRLEEAEQAFRAAYEMRLHDEAVFYLGNLYKDQGRLDDAERHYRRALADGDTSVLLNLGNLVSQRGRSREAISLYRRAIAAGDVLGWNNLGAELAKIGKHRQARRAFAQGARHGDELALENLDDRA